MRAIFAAAAAVAVAAIGMCAVANATKRDVASAAIIASAVTATAIDVCLSDRLDVIPHRGLGGGPAWSDAVSWGLDAVTFTVTAVATARPRT